MKAHTCSSCGCPVNYEHPFHEANDYCVHHGCESSVETTPCDRCGTPLRDGDPLCADCMTDDDVRELCERIVYEAEAYA